MSKIRKYEASSLYLKTEKLEDESIDVILRLISIESKVEIAYRFTPETLKYLKEVIDEAYNEAAEET